MSIVRPRVRLRCVALLLVAWLHFLIGIHRASAVEHQWLGANGPLWFIPSNWSPASVPNGPQDDVRFDLFMGGTSIIEVISNPIMVRKFTFDQNITEYNLVALLPSHLMLAPGGTTVDVISGEHTIAADIVGSVSLTKTGSGKLTLSRNNAYTGDTIVEAGTLTINDSMFPDQELLSANVILGTDDGDSATFDVSSFSTYEIGLTQSLRGNGSVLGFITNRGTIAPGSSPAILEISTDYQQMATGALEIGIGGVTPGLQHDQLRVAGAAFLASRLDLRRIDLGSGLFVPDAGDSMEVLTAASVIDEFDSVSFANPPSDLAVDVVYAPQGVTVQFVKPQPANYNKLTTGTVNWNDTAIWGLGGNVPSLKSTVDLRNESIRSLPTTVRVDDHAFAHSVNVSGRRPQGTMTLVAAEDRSLSAPHEVAVDSNGVLAGLGTIVGNLTNDAGAVSPGDPSKRGGEIGQLTIDGNYQQNARGQLQIDISSGGADKILATGDAMISGNLNLNLVGELPGEGECFTIVEAAGAVFGTFNPVDTSAMGPSYLMYNDDSVIYKVTKRFNMDLDDAGLINGKDIDDFVLGLIDPNLYEQEHPGNFPHSVGDAEDDDLLLDFDDIPAFEAALLAESGIVVSILSLLGVPEPTSVQLLIAGLLVASANRRVRVVRVPC